MCGNLEELSKLSRDLALSSMQPYPEEYIKQTLLAHGFFKHAESLSKVNCGPGNEFHKSGAEDKGKEKISIGITEEDKKKTTQLISLVKEGKEVHKLREPRNLYAHAGQESHQNNLPLWPLEVPCVKQDIKFTMVAPPKPEPFFRSEFEVVSPKIRSNGGGVTTQVVYTNPLGPEKYFTAARAGPSPGLCTPTPASPGSTSLVFESRFESGNLAKAVQVGKWNYELYLRYDLYTNKHTQWFYFSVSNMRKDQTYRFTIVNLYKAGSLYNEGMQPVMYSLVGSKEKKVGWTRSGHSIKYFKTPIRRVDTKQETYYYGLTWSHKFEYDKDTCYFAHCYPYTYSDLQEYIRSITSDRRKSEYVKVRNLCRTIAGNGVPVLTITSPVKSQTESKAKRAVVLTARVHPGETNGSWMMKGFLDFILGQSPDAKILRDTFVFKVIPMLNPDGVIVGNYRCSLAGRDLNRNYRSMLKDSYPTIWHAKSMVKKLAEDREIVLFCDFHGHSRKQNVFIYGCDTMDNPLTRLKSRVFPKMLSKNASDMFTYKGSSFGVHKSKAGTGRVVMWREMGVTNSYTMEATFCGSDLGKKAGFQFSMRDLEAMGYHFCDTLLDYCDPDQSKVQFILQSLEDEYRQSILNKLAALGQRVPPGVDPLDLAVDLGSDDNSSDMGSDSSESDGPPVHLLAKEARKKKKKKLKSRRERNKHKALLKLTHSTVKHVVQSTGAHSTHTSGQESQQQALPVPHEEPVTSSRGQGMVDMSSPYRYSQTEMARNGGIPVFVQERLEERLRKRSDMELDIRLPNNDAEYVDVVAMQYVKHGVPEGMIQEATQQDPRKSVTAFPHSTDCPISITSMALIENKGTRPPSRLSNKPSFPHLDENPKGAFASHYVANHLRDVVSSLRPSSPANPHESNNTKNLANLSKLFRQLKPQPLYPESRNPKTDFRTSNTKLKGSLRPEENTNSLKALHNPSLVEFHHIDENTNASTSSNLEPQESSSNRPCNILETQPLTKKEHLPVTQKRGEILRQDMPIKQNRTLPERSKDTLTVHDKKILAEVRPSATASILGKVSPLTSSWESFTRPMELSDRSRDDTEPVLSSSDKKTNGKPDELRLLDSLPTEKKDLSEPTIHYDALLKSLGLKQKKKQMQLPKSQSAPDQSSIVIPSLEGTITNSHENIAQAHTKPRKSKHDSRVTKPVKTSPNKTNHKKNIADAVDKIKQKKESKKRGGNFPKQQEQLTSVQDDYPTLQELVEGRREIPSCMLQSSVDYMNDRVNQLLDEPPTGLTNTQSSIEKYVPVSTSRIFSSKPPSRYGPRPTPENGVIPATVSLMLGGRVKSRPSTMYSSRRPRPLHVRYHTKTIRTSMFNKQS